MRNAAIFISNIVLLEIKIVALLAYIPIVSLSLTPDKSISERFLKSINNPRGSLLCLFVARD